MASGKRSVGSAREEYAFTKSGMIRFCAQSPPPITFPARAIAIGDLAKLFTHDWVAISAAALEALYGSSPPSSSDSVYPRRWLWFL